METTTTGRIVIGETDRRHLTRAARWARFIAIVQFVYCGVCALSFIAMLIGMTVAGASMGEMSTMFLMWPKAAVVAYFVFLLALMGVMLILTIYLYRFAVKTLAAIDRGDDALMTEAFANLGRHYRLYGIMMLVCLALVVLIIVGAIIFAGALAGAMR
jgi:hypothetical protein